MELKTNVYTWEKRNHILFLALQYDIAALSVSVFHVRFNLTLSLEDSHTLFIYTL